MWIRNSKYFLEIFQHKQKIAKGFYLYTESNQGNRRRGLCECIRSYTCIRKSLHWLYTLYLICWNMDSVHMDHPLKKIENYI